jgi:predicted double-glycine peptidase
VVRIQHALFSEQGHGIYASDMRRYLEQNGFQVFAFSGDEAALTHHIELGRPLIVALKPGSGPRLHYVVVVGVDSANRVLLVNEPAQRKLMKVDARAFEHQWKATGNWTLLAVPRSRAP